MGKYKNKISNIFDNLYVIMFFFILIQKRNKKETKKIKTQILIHPYDLEVWVGRTCPIPLCGALCRKLFSRCYAWNLLFCSFEI